MAKDLAQVVAKYKTNAGSAQGAYVDGINNTTVDPTALAVANQAGMLAGVTQAITSGYWANRLRAVGKQGWQSAAIAKAGNYGTGITAGAPRYEQSMSTWLPRIQSVAAAAKAMPGQTVDQRLQRATYLGKTLYNAKRGL